MSREQLISDLYALHTQMTTANGFNYDWAVVETWENGAFAPSTTPTYFFETEPEINADETNGVGNNEFQNELPILFKFGKTLITPDPALNKVGENLEIVKAKMLHDIKRAFGSPYKIDIPGWYCGSEYNGEVEPEEEENLDPYTVIDYARVTITYKEGRGIGEW